VGGGGEGGVLGRGGGAGDPLGHLVRPPDGPGVLRRQDAAAGAAEAPAAAAAKMGEAGARAGSTDEVEVRADPEVMLFTLPGSRMAPLVLFNHFQFFVFSLPLKKSQQLKYSTVAQQQQSVFSRRRSRVH
jgi:hypothetical protein